VIIFVFLWGISNQRDGRPASQPHQHRLRQLPRRESLSKVPRNRTTSLGSSSKGQATHQRRPGKAAVSKAKPSRKRIPDNHPINSRRTPVKMRRQPR
jgi:hypothetical protein